MTITINGNGTVTGVSVGGLPDGIVDTDMLAADAVTAPKIGTKSYVSCAFIADKKAQNTAGGSSTANNHIQRDLNHEFYDPDGIVSISSNAFTIASAGTYIIEWSAPAFASNQHVSRLRNVAGTVQEGTCEYSHQDSYSQTRSTGSARVTQTGSETYKIMHRVASSKSTNGFGVACNSHGNYDVYTWVKIYKEA